MSLNSNDTDSIDPEKGAASPKQEKKKTNEDDEKFWNVILGLLLFLVCLMLYNEIVRHYNHRQQVFWDDHYLAAVRSDPLDWKFGFRLEDLEQRIISQRDVLVAESKIIDQRKDGILSKLSHKWHHETPSSNDMFASVDPHPSSSQTKLATDIFSHIENSSSYVTISCVARPSFYLRIGPDDFRDVPTDRCQVFSGASSHSVLGAHSLWEKVDLGNGAVGFRALSNGNFLKVVAPKSDEWNTPWKLEVVSPLPGLGERFQLMGGKIYSELMHGYLQCSGDGLAEAVKGFPGETLYEESSEYLFNLSKVSPSQLSHGRELRQASAHINAMQSSAAAIFKSMNHPPPFDKTLLEKGFKIALCVPMTSRGTDMSAVDQSPLWFNLFASFMESIDWSKNNHEFTFYLGVDKGDPLYDTGDAWSDLRSAFNKNTRRALSWLNYDNSSIAEQVLSKQLKLKLMDFTDTTGAPSQVVVGLVNKAYSDGADYFFQVNDDTVIVSKEWANSFITVLQNNPLQPNLGITGPVDTNNDRILTHAFAHRTHVEIFGCFFPKSFKNWWSDDWISTVYGSAHTFRMYDVLVTHNVQSQKTGSFNRYAVDESAKYALRKELSLGFVSINKWLVAHHLPRLALPSICGYSPLIADLYDDLMKKVVGVS